MFRCKLPFGVSTAQNIRVADPSGLRIPCRAASRRGVAVLWIAIASIVVLLVWGFGREFVTSSTRASAQASVEARLAESLAESVVAEAEAQIGFQVNALDGPLAEILRRPVLGGEAGDVDLSPFFDSKQVEAILTTPVWRGYRVDSVRARVAFQRQIDSNPLEKRGLVVFQATVSSPGRVRQATRRVELGRWLKTTLTVPPRPFGSYGLFLGDATGLTDADTVNLQRDRAADLCRQVRVRLQGLGSLGNAEFRDSCEKILGDSFDPDRPGAMPRAFSLPDGAALYGLLQEGVTQDLANLDLGRRLEDLYLEGERASAKFSRLCDTADIGIPGNRSELLSQASVTLARVVAPLLELWAFYNVYAILTPADVSAWAVLTRDLDKLTKDYFVRRAHYILQESPQVTDLSDRVRAILDRKVHGVIHIENVTAPVSLSGSVAANVILVIGSGGANVRDLNSDPASEGVVTLVVSSGPIQVAGINRMALMVVAPSGSVDPAHVEILPGTRIHGGLVSSSLSWIDRLDGTLDRVERFYSGFTHGDGTEHGFADRIFVGLSPRIHFKRTVIP